VNLIVILITFVWLLYSINCPTVICLPSMLFILWRDITSELWTPVHSFTLWLPFTIYSLYLHSCKTTIFYHSIHLIICLQQIGEIDNLTVSWGKVLGCVVCRFHIAAGAKLRPRRGAIYKLYGAVVKLASINIRKLVLSPTSSKIWSLNPLMQHFLFVEDLEWFLKLPWSCKRKKETLTLVSYWGKTCCCAHHTFLLGFPTGRTSTRHLAIFWRHCRGERGFLQGESLASNLLLCYCSALFYFCLHLFIKNTKNLVPL
jgi:hypothetical protein